MPALLRLAVKTVFASSVSDRALVAEIADLIEWYRGRVGGGSEEGDEVAEDWGDGELNVDEDGGRGGREGEAVEEAEERGEVEKDEIKKWKRKGDTEQDRAKSELLQQLMNMANIAAGQLLPRRGKMRAKNNPNASRPAQSRCQRPHLMLEVRMLPSLRTIRHNLLEQLCNSNNSAEGGIETHLNDCTTLKRICHLWRVVDYFIKEYVAKVRADQKLLQTEYSSVLTGTGLEHINVPSQLSPVEYGRLQRAFFNFEFYRRLHGGLNLFENLPKISADRLGCWKFMMQLSFFEKAEFYCIYLHLLDHAEDMLDKIEEHAEEALRAASSNGSGVATRQGSTLRASSRHLANLPLFQRSIEQKTTIIFLIELGLPLLQKLSQIDIMQQMTIFNRMSWLPSDWREILFWRCSPSTPHNSMSYFYNSNDLSSPSPAFKLLGSRADVEFSSGGNAATLDQGFFFWEDIKRPTKNVFIQRPFSPSPRKQQRAWKRSFEKQLHGLAISRSTVEASLPLVLTNAEIESIVSNNDY